MQIYNIRHHTLINEWNNVCITPLWRDTTTLRWSSQRVDKWVKQSDWWIYLKRTNYIRLFLAETRKISAYVVKGLWRGARRKTLTLWRRFYDCAYNATQLCFLPPTQGTVLRRRLCICTVPLHCCAHFGALKSYLFLVLSRVPLRQSTHDFLLPLNLWCLLIKVTCSFLWQADNCNHSLLTANINVISSHSTHGLNLYRISN